jgi:ATP-dependent helicase STH1/SNF2
MQAFWLMRWVWYALRTICEKHLMMKDLSRANSFLLVSLLQGKTIQAISLLAYLMEFKQNLGPFLVIVPLSTLSNWQNEFSKWCPAARTVCFKGTPLQRKEIYKDQVRAGHFNVLLTTYEYIIRDKKYLRKIDWEVVIIDEGHRMKNSQSKFAVTLSSQYTTKFRVLLTGTPLMNDLGELWSLLNYLLPTVRFRCGCVRPSNGFVVVC